MAFEKCAWFLSAEKMGPLQTTWKCAGQRGGWLEHPFRVDAVAAALGRHIWSAHHRATERPPGKLDKAGLGLMAWYKAMF